MAGPWLRRLAAGLSPWRPVFDPQSVHVRFVVDKVTLGQVLPRVLWFTLSILFHRCSITRRGGLIIFVTGLHNKPQGCCASIASAAGPFKKENPITHLTQFTNIVNISLSTGSY